MGYICFNVKQKLREKFRFSKELIPLIFINLLLSLSLGVNYVASAVPSFNDGIGIHSFLSYLVIGEDNWSINLFKSYFDYSVYIGLFLILLYCILRLIEKYRHS
jgi:hypothetical protein